ncbi:MAG: prephenate dehydratase [Candidatus Vogelbacteria bacterium CG10_big_fil_rev_8_21_14_0_10_45_14]|uniref:prephenate dehydratase n=1 Tax=Candidatus Vogelbacteria bacterium CG10_big_fil_rev_8_21_14_0_10_45_14 TaxID=1975042 RepID=A0A2H0RK24_9BACT|nr:MAG: prephenate dehydratase [Candidatus Vogelbacteria bacterium CG10_big_fil_rev_8_21_14_0_10_45_14]
MTIGVSGREASFSEAAAREWCDAGKIINFELKYLVSVDAVLLALTLGEIDRGIFPIENQNGGIVIEAVHAMAKYSFKIETLFNFEVKHCLMAKSGANVADITAIASHDQALKQCRMYLKRNWSGVELIEWEDTAGAALDLSEGRIKANAAVIAPLAAASRYGLSVLEEGIQDMKWNFTTFVSASG